MHRWTRSSHCRITPSPALVSSETLQPPRLIAVVNTLRPPLATLNCLPRPHGLPSNSQRVTDDGGDRCSRS
ncbi:MAG: hypothetical protein F4Y87_03590 [Synechococcus sp. SB0665_bin_28]|nr:hypothetical protein [Synechococcus sp. SB0665_bin_28]